MRHVFEGCLHDGSLQKLQKMNFVASSYIVGNNLRANVAKNKYIYISKRQTLMDHVDCLKQ